MHRFSIMDSTGHSTVEYDPANRVSVEEAMQRFEQLTRDQGMIAAVRTGPGEHRLVKTFDPGAEETVFHRQLVGG